MAPGLVWDPSVALGLARATAHDLSLAQRYALLCRASAPDLQDRLRAPAACRDLARLLPGVLAQLAMMMVTDTPLMAAVFGLTEPDTPLAAASTDQAAAPATGAAAWLSLFESCDAMRRPDRCLDLLAAAACVIRRLDIPLWAQRLQAVRSVDAGAIARDAGGDATRIREGLRAARLRALLSLGAVAQPGGRVE